MTGIYTYVVAVDGSGFRVVSQPTITSVSVAASIAASFAGSTGVAISGAGAVSINSVRTRTNASIESSDVSNAGDVTLSATGSSSITALVVGVSIAVAGSGSTAVGVSIGVSVARNFIGRELDGTLDASEVRAFVTGSKIDAGGTLSQTAQADDLVTAIVVAISVALAASGGTGIGASGSGVYAENRIADHVGATIAGGGGITAPGGVSLRADDLSLITAIAGAASAAFAFSGSTAVAVSVAVTIASNEIGNTVEASVTGATKLEATGGPVSIEADDHARIRAFAGAISVALAGSGDVGIGIAGSGTVGFNQITTQVKAELSGTPTVVSGGGVSVGAHSYSSIDVFVISISGAVGVGGEAAGIGIAGAGSAAVNGIAGSVEATVDGATTLAPGGSVEARATDEASIRAIAGAAAIAIGGSAGVGVGAAFGISIAINQIGGVVIDGVAHDHLVRAQLSSSTVATQATRAASVLVEALSTPSIETYVLAGAAGVGASGGVSGALAGAGAAALNTVLSRTEALVVDSTIWAGSAASRSTRPTSPRSWPTPAALPPQSARRAACRSRAPSPARSR